MLTHMLAAHVTLLGKAAQLISSTDRISYTPLCGTGSNDLALCLLNSFCVLTWISDIEKR
jgi:hypothetical protein